MPGYFPLDVPIVRVSGEKAALFLNGQFTNDIKNLREGEANYNLFLTQKGKIVADLTVHRQKDDFLLVIPKPFVPRIMDHLLRLAPLSRVTLTDETERYRVIHAITPLLCKEGWGKVEQCGMIFRMSRLGVEGFDCIIPTDAEKTFLDALRKKGLPELDAAAQEVIRVENGIAHVGIDATEENLPQEAGLMRAISLTKGCYLGQEVVARLQYRGHVNKILVGLKIGKSPSPSPLPSPQRGDGNLVGEKIYLEGKEVGKITSAIFSSTINSPLALGYVPFSHKDPGNRFEIGGQRVEGVVVSLPIKPSPSSP